jgi:hypothetical protein
MLRRIVFALVSALASLVLFATAASAESCPNEQLRQESNSANLPDCRAYVQVSPSDKSENDVSVTFGLIRSDAAGDALIFTSPGAFAGAMSGAPANWYLSRRQASGEWGTHALIPPQEPSQVMVDTPPRLIGFSADFDTGVLRDLSHLLPDSPADEPNLYSENTSNRTVELITPAPLNGIEPGDFLFATQWLGGISTDGSHVAFEAPRALVEGAPTGPGPYGVTSAYGWTASHGVELLGVLPDGSPAAEGSSIGVGATGTVGARGGNYTDRAVSSDGDRVVFTAPNLNPGGVNTGHLYQRVDGESTIDLSASQRTPLDPNGPQPAQFWTAATDGSIIYFTSAEKLTDDATTDSTAGGNDLYRFNTGTGSLQDISIDAADPAGAQVQGVLGASADGSTVYFAAHGVMAPGAVAGNNNVYVWHAGDATPSLVAPEAAPSNWETGNGIESRVTPDGEFLLFSSQAKLTALNNGGHLADYRFDRGTATTVCVSCNPNGSAATADTTIDSFLLGNLDSNFESYLPRLMSDDGQRVFFETTEALVPQDGNGEEDVYEYESGRVSMISSGQSGQRSLFEDSSADGGDVFFATIEPLESTDRDGLYDIYDATTHPVPPQSAAAKPCSDDGCQGQPASPPSFQSPTTEVVGGNGNAQPAGTATKPASAKPVKQLTRAQKLTRALRACRARRHKGSRPSCEARARKSYGPPKRLQTNRKAER